MMLGGDAKRERTEELYVMVAVHLGTRIEGLAREKITGVEKKRARSAHMSEEVMQEHEHLRLVL